MQTNYDWSIPRRQPNAAIFVVFHKVVLYLVRILWPLLLVWLFQSRKEGTSNSEMLIITLAALMFVYSLLEYWFFRFSIPGNELIIKKGFLVKQTVVLPLSKIQAVHIDQNWLHRLLNLSQVSFDSPGSANTEVKIAMHRQSAESLREFILGNIQFGQEKTEEGPKETPFFRMEQADLFKLGLSANHLEAFFILVGFAISLIDDIENATGQEYEGILKWMSDLAAGSDTAILLMLGMIALFVSVVVSFVRIVLQYGNFRISKTSKGFQIQSGLINTKEKLVPFNKIQFISWRANWVRKKIPLYLLQFHSIGTNTSRRKWEIKVPITRMDLLPSLLQTYHPSLPLDSPVIKISPAYILRRTLVRGVISSLLLTAVGFSIFGMDALWILLLIVYSLIASWLFQKNYRLLLHKDALQIHQGIFGREEILLQWDKIQSVQIRQGLYQWRKELATVKLFTASGVIIIPFIRISQAMGLRDYALYRVESSSKAWI